MQRILESIEHNKILAAFQHQFSSSPTLLVRSPGRVNIILLCWCYRQQTTSIKKMLVIRPTKENRK